MAQLREKGSDADLLREMIGYLAQRLMKADPQVIAAIDATGA